MLFTGSVKDIDKSKYDEIWIITRKIGNVQTGGNIYHVPQLSPSYGLLNRYLSWRSQGIWNKDQFDTVYTPQFLNEMRVPMAQQYLKLLQSRSKEKNVLICCFCNDESMCHRSLVKSIIESMNNAFYLLIAGSRSFNDDDLLKEIGVDNYALLKERCDYFLQNQRDSEIHIVSGGARGADTLAERYAKERGYQLHVFPAQWDVYGKSAGYRRNEQMHKFISQFEKRGCLCFWDGESKGTAHNFRLCEIFNTPLRVVRFCQ